VAAINAQEARYAASLLSDITSTSVAVISLAFAKKEGGGGGGGVTGGFGHLIPTGEGGNSPALGVIYDSDVFPNQYPKDVAGACFVGQVPSVCRVCRVCLECSRLRGWATRACACGRSGRRASGACGHSASVCSRLQPQRRSSCMLLPLLRLSVRVRVLCCTGALSC
jgi:hypothetical protein